MLVITVIIGQRLAKAIRPKPSMAGFRPGTVAASPRPSGHLQRKGQRKEGQDPTERTTKRRERCLNWRQSLAVSTTSRRRLRRGKAQHYFEKLVQGMTITDFLLLLEVGVTSPFCYEYDFRTRVASRPAPTSMPWPIEFILTCFNKKHIFQAVLHLCLQ